MTTGSGSAAAEAIPARKLVAEANVLLRKGEVDAARRRFAEAYGLDPRVAGDDYAGLLRQLAREKKEEGERSVALQLYQEAWSAAQSPQLKGQLATQVAKLDALIKPSLPKDRIGPGTRRALRTVVALLLVGAVGFALIRAVTIRSEAEARAVAVAVARAAATATAVVAPTATARAMATAAAGASATAVAQASAQAEAAVTAAATCATAITTAGQRRPPLVASLTQDKSSAGGARIVLENAGDIGTLWSLSRHDAVVLSLAFSPVSALLASSSGDGTVKLWDVESGKLIRTLFKHRAFRETSVEAVAFSPADGRLLASASDDGIVRLWEVGALVAGATEQEAETCTLPHVGAVRGMAFSPDGRLLAAGGDDHTVKVWDLAGGTLRTLPQGAAVRAVAFSPADGRLLAVGGDDRAVKLWSVDSGSEVMSLGEQSAAVRAVAFSPDGRLLAVGGDNRAVKLYDLDDGTLRTVPHGAGVRGVAFSPADGRLLASYALDGSVRLWNVRDEAGVHEVHGFVDHAGAARDYDSLPVAFSPDGRLLASYAAGNVVNLRGTR